MAKMIIEGTVLKTLGDPFAIIIVKMPIFADTKSAEAAVRSVMPFFPNMPIVLMAQNEKGTAFYKGRPDIVKHLSSMDSRRIPWKKYTIG